jgi:hypothetical protein
MPVEEGQKAVGGRNDEGSGIVVGRLNGRTELMTDRRNFLGGLAAASCLALAGCGTEYVDFSNPQSIGSSAGAIAKRLEAEKAGRGVMFARALYRAATPVGWRAPADDFDPKDVLRLVTDRGAEPELLGPDFCQAVMAGAARLGGADVRTISSIYCADDGAALGLQWDWAKGFGERIKRRIATLAFDEQRRKGIIERVTPRKAGYRWTSGSRRVPVVDVEMFNPIDRPLTGIEFAVDLIDPGGQVVASAVMPFSPTVALQPGVFGQYAVDVGQYKGFNDPAYRDLRDPVRVSMKVRDIFVDDHQSVLQARDDSRNDDARRIAIGRLISEIVDARNNLAKYRAAFG